MTSPAFSDIRSLSQMRRRLIEVGADPEDAETELVASLLHHESLPVLAWDLDSTIADTLHRQHMIAKIKAGEMTWDDYSLACTDDTLIPGTAWLMDKLAVGARNFIITGRSEIARELTEEWLGIRGVNYERLIMRQSGDHRPNPVFKVATLRDLEGEGIKVEGFFDDWPDAAQAVRAAFPQLPVVVLNPCYPADAPHANAPGSV